MQFRIIIPSQILFFPSCYNQNANRIGGKFSSPDRNTTCKQTATKNGTIHRYTSSKIFLKIQGKQNENKYFHSTLKKRTKKGTIKNQGSQRQIKPQTGFSQAGYCEYFCHGLSNFTSFLSAYKTSFYLKECLLLLLLSFNIIDTGSLLKE